MSLDRPSRRRALLGVAGLAALTGLSACGRGAAPTDEQGRVRLRFASGGATGAELGGFYQAVANGAYQKRGLTVEILTGAAGADAPGLLAASAVELAFARDSFAPLRLIGSGAPVKAVAAFFQKDPAVLIARPERGVEGFPPVEGRAVLMTERDRAGVWSWLNGRDGFTADQARVQPPQDLIDAFLAEREALLIGRLTDGDVETVRRRAGQAPHLRLPADEGYPGYGALVMAPNAFARDNAQALRAFIAASVEGWRDYVHGDGARGDALIRRAAPATAQAALDAAREALKANAVVDGGDAALYGLGTMTPARWQAFAEQTAAAFIDGAPDWREAFTIQYLPARG